jgi:hypothetical protein
MIDIIVAVGRSLHLVWQTLQVPVCFVSAWGLVVMLGWRLTATIRSGVTTSKHLHRIPCANCQFFTNDHRLKCTIHPDIALSERAIDCCDYQDHPLLSH